MTKEIKKIDYTKEALKILRNEGMHSTEESRLIKNEKDFIAFMVKHFPLGSSTYERFRRIVGRRYKREQKDEYILVSKFKNYGQIDSVDFIKRSKAEYNPEYVQKVVSCIPYLPNGDLVLQFAGAGDMKCFTTIISGHVSYSDDYMKETSNNFLLMNIQRELFEETGINKSIDVFTHNRILYDRDLIQKDPSNISAYHMGHIFNVPFTEEEFASIKNEPGLTAIRYKPNEDILLHNPDSWISEILKL